MNNTRNVLLVAASSVTLILMGGFPNMNSETTIPGAELAPICVAGDEFGLPGMYVELDLGGNLIFDGPEPRQCEGSQPQSQEDVEDLKQTLEYHYNVDVSGEVGQIDEDRYDDIIDAYPLDYSDDLPDVSPDGETSFEDSSMYQDIIDSMLLDYSGTSVDPAMTPSY